MKSNYEQFDLPTVTHQNGFGSTMLFGVPTFISRITSVFRQSECHVLSCMYLASAVVQNAELSVNMRIFTVKKDCYTLKSLNFTGVKLSFFLRSAELTKGFESD